MSSKIITVIICVLMTTSIFGSFAQNVGQPQFSGQPKPTSGGSGGLADSPWPMYQQNNQHTSLSLYDASGNNTLEKWNFKTGNGVASSPSIGFDGTIYVGSQDHKLYANNPNGTEKWNFPAIYEIDSSPAVGLDGTVYIGSRDSNLYAIYPNGTLKWTFSAGNMIYSSPLIGHDGTIYVGSHDYNLYAIGRALQSQPPIANAGPDQTVNEGDLVQFDGSESYIPNVTIDSYEWDFDANNDSDGDGNTTNDVDATGPNPTHVYGDDGVYNVTLTVRTEGQSGSTYNIGQDVIFCVDVSGSMDPFSIPIIKEGLTNYVNEMKVPDQGAVVLYGGPASLMNPLTDIYSDLLTDIGNIPDPPTGPFTPMGDAMDIAVSELLLNGNASTHIQVIILLTDGYNNAGVEPFFPTQKAVDNNIGIFTIGLGPLVEEATLIEIASRTGGKYYYAPDPTFLISIYQNISKIVENLTTEEHWVSDTCEITVLNVDPTVSIESVDMDVEVGLRVAGRKYNNVTMTLFEESNPIGNVSIQRLPGSPDEQMAWIPAVLDLNKIYSVTVSYEPVDPPYLGANPIWIYLKSQNGSIRRIHHTFNVQQSKERDSDHWNHIDPWEVELNAYLIGFEFDVEYHVADPGSDDVVMTVSYGSQNMTITHLIDPSNPDPYPSPDVNQRDIYGIVTLIYEGPGMLTMNAKDDDNIRLGIGEGSISINI